MAFLIGWTTAAEGEDLIICFSGGDTTVGVIICGLGGLQDCWLAGITGATGFIGVTGVIGGGLFAVEALEEQNEIVFLVKIQES